MSAVKHIIVAFVVNSGYKAKFNKLFLFIMCLITMKFFVHLIYSTIFLIHLFPYYFFLVRVSAIKQPSLTPPSPVFY